ncbi:hypothetical protein ERO13_A03G035066v2 [Gossypium hirsutum]|nr:non-structural maintenance of chromosomes element 1 homolog [Gossypium hirsutum]KAB2089168.1 hypothetical protein ES319_A03G043400v1 [Gossypium barbadense]TYH23899.1 hypothetical protein ES288_A03G048300v1 [Gossypium darwinii]TYI35042.1 hypothetical protein ES332_A03G048700v1 [Gossypium tomentosum]KAG4206909.1 hypothetical protein ERO13_A03G035066v2 [Gossypium hirsutum]PPR94083.1 hypothetical protein GOBAR_AA26586 [Gossypium barbadense]
MAVLSWKHHTLIQSLLERGPLTEKEFHLIFTGITGQNPGTHQGKFNDYLLKINRELSYVQLDLRACRDPYDGRVYFGVVNNVSDDQSKLGTKYSVPQIAFFKAIVETIAQDVTAEGTICNLDALNIKLENQVLNSSGSQSQDVPAAFKNFTMSHKEKTLDQLVKDKWLCYTEDDNIGLGVRSILDLRSWFHNAGVPSCQVCNEAGFKAKLCPNDGCVVRIHHYCLKKRFSQKGVLVCPSCETQWQYQPPKAEPIEVENEETEPVQSQPSSNPGPSQPSLRSKRKRQRLNDAETAGCSSQESGANRKRVTRSSAHPR